MKNTIILSILIAIALAFEAVAELVRKKSAFNSVMTTAIAAIFLSLLLIAIG